MDKDRVGGIGHQISGAPRQAAGTMTGNATLKAEGAMERTGGRLWDAAGKGRDAVRDVLKD